MELRQIALYVARVRVGLGIMMLAAPKAVFGPLYGSAAGEPGPAAVGRMMGAREAALGAGAAIAVAERTGGGNWVSMLAVADGLDAVVNFASPKLGWRGKAVGVMAAASAAAHLVLAQRLAADS